MDAADVQALFALLAPDVRWGAPDDVEGGCQNRKQVRSWYEAAFGRGVRATVTEVVPSGDRLLVGLSVSGRSDGAEERWQVLTVRDGLIADIRGFDNRPDAAARAGLVG